MRSAHPFSLVETPKELVERYRANGWTTGRSVSTLLNHNVNEWGALPALTFADRTFTYAQLGAHVARFSDGLRAAGIGPGDVVCWQTPNWWESWVVGLGVWNVGAISAPVVPIYRESEIRFIVDQLRPAAVVTTGGVQRGCDHVALFEDVLADVGHRPSVKISIRGLRTGWEEFDAFGRPTRELSPALEHPDLPCLVLYTSGTTSAPKGVIHTHRSLMAETDQYIRAWGWGPEDVSYLPAPLQHIVGILIGITAPQRAGGNVVVEERWQPDTALATMERHRVTIGAGATIFLSEILQQVRLSSAGSFSLKAFACGGAAVSPGLIHQCDERGIKAFRLYGMTELPSATMMGPHHSLDLRAQTDGLIAPGVEVQTRTSSGELLPLGKEGELWLRGPERMAGYVDSSLNPEVLDENGWLSTGDLGQVTDGCVNITGRVKDIINRGGEKFSAQGIEEHIANHPAVREVAVVAGADIRFGEVPVAFVVTTDPVTEASLRDQLILTGVAMQKVPARWHFMASLPRTPSGKVQKHLLQE